MAGAEKLKEISPHQFEWWAVDLVNDRPAQDSQKGADKGMDGDSDFLHRPANTLEALARRDPRLAASILLAELRRRPSSAAFLLLALPLELVSMALALADRAWGPGSSPVWPKVEAP